MMYQAQGLRRQVKLTWLGWFFLGLASNSHAVLTENLSIGSAQALALGNAVTADPPGIDSIHFNPAGLTALKGRQGQFKIISSTFDIKLKFGEYNAEQQTRIAGKKAQGIYPDSYFSDSAHNNTSETAGAAVMIPGLGLTNVPAIIGPMGGVSYSAPGSKMTFATSVYTPLIAGFYRDSNDPGRYIGERLSFTLLTYFSPSIGYEINDQISVGGALTFNYSGTGLELPFRSGSALLDQFSTLHYQQCAANSAAVNCDKPLGMYDSLGDLSLEAENPLSFGFNAGILWKPKAWAQFGAVYQSTIKMKMKGDFTWKNSASWDTFYAPLLSHLGIITSDLSSGSLHKGSAKINMEFPEHYAFGASFKLNPKIKLNLDYKHTAWSKWKGIPLEFSQSIDFLGLAAKLQPDIVNENSLTFPFELKDSWNLAMGMQYQYSDSTCFRVGLEDRPSSIPKSSQSPLLPIGSGILYGLGIGYKTPKSSLLDFSLGYFSSKTDMPGGTSKMGNSTDPNLVIYNPFAGTDIKTEVEFYLMEFSYRAEF